MSCLNKKYTFDRFVVGPCNDFAQATVKPPDIETRTAIVKRKMQDNRTAISDDVAHYIAALVTSNIRATEGFLVQVSAYSVFTGSEINIDLVKRAIKIFQKFDSETK